MFEYGILNLKQALAQKWIRGGNDGRNNIMEEIIYMIMTILMLSGIFVMTVGRQIMLYRRASRQLNDGMYRVAAETFHKCGFLKMSKYASAQAEAESGNYLKAIRIFASLGAFKDSEQMLEYYKARMYEADGKYKAALEAYKLNPFFKDSQERIAKLDACVQAEAEGKYKAAAEAFDKLGSFADAEKMSMYARAQAEAESGNYLKAIRTFASIGTYRDSEQMLGYYKARMYEAEDKYNAALETYKLNPLFKDSLERIAKIEMHACRLISGFSEGLACVENIDGEKRLYRYDRQIGHPMRMGCGWAFQ